MSRIPSNQFSHLDDKESADRTQDTHHRDEPGMMSRSQMDVQMRSTDFARSCPSATNEDEHLPIFKPISHRQSIEYTIGNSMICL